MGVSVTGSGQAGVIALPLSIAQFAPGIFSTNGEATGQGAVQNLSYQLVDSLNPARAGTTTVVIYCTGLGPVTNGPPTGAPAPGDPLAQTMTIPTVSIGGMQATVSFSGLVPGAVGLYQVNALVPQTTPAGSAVPLSLSIRDQSSNTVTIAVTSP